MADEKTSLVGDPDTPGPSSYSFPGRVPRDSGRNRMIDFKFYICSSFCIVIIVAILISLTYTFNTVDDAISNDNEVSAEGEFLNSSEILFLMVTKPWPIEDETPTQWLLPMPNILQRDGAVNAGIKALGDRELVEEFVQSPDVNTPSFRHQRAVSTTAEARKLTRRAYVENHATLSFAKQQNYRKSHGRNNIGNGPMMGLDLKPRNSTKCNFTSKYRYDSGICNNKKQPFKNGVAYIPFRRAMNPDYADGITAPRQSHTGRPLPSAREVSLTIHRPSYSIDPHFTVMLAVYGQFLDHDITATALNQGQDGEPIDCCNNSTGKFHPECFPVPIGVWDPNYEKYNMTCMNFVRSAPAPTNQFGPRQQLNQATAYIDGSVVYGSTPRKVQLLRTSKDGLLRMFLTPDNRTLLPVSTDPMDGCNQAEKNAQGKYCFESGDTRANENLHLTSMHLIWARQHNYLAQGLQQINPHWDDETLFQEARRILGAQMQHITYNEFLTVILGQNYTEKIGIAPRSHKTFDTYDGNVDASIANVFAACAFRFAHTLLPGLFNASKDRTTTESVALHTMLFNPYSLWAQGGLDDAIHGAISTSLSKLDQYFTTELTQKLFENIAEEQQNDTKTTKRRLPGLDLVSLNIQRGRDHGLPSYVEWRKYCQMPTIRNWDDLNNAVDADSLRSMKLIYGDVGDVDVYTGALSEPPMDGAILGPLLSCILTDQFLRLKKGDSHWYERRVGPQKMTKEQLNEIYDTTLAGVICRNSDAVTQSQKYVMRKVSENNEIVNCDTIDTFNFEPWKEQNPRQGIVRIHQSSHPKIMHDNSSNSDNVGRVKLGE